MRTIVFGLLAAVVAGGAVWAAQVAARNPSVYTDGLYGFSIQAPAFPPAPPGGGVIPVMLLGPSENGFTSNVNVLVQMGTTTRDALRQTMLGQVKTMGFKVNAQRDVTVGEKPALLMDYEGQQAGKDLRVLSLSVIGADRVFTITCTGLKDAFPKYEKAFVDCVNSFRLN